MKPADLERRRFLQNAAVTGASFWLLPVASFTSGCKVTDTPVPGKFLSKEQAQAAQVLADQIIPSDSVEPGAAQLGVTDYIEQLLTAFDHDPPRIYAAQNSNGDFIPLNRYQEAAWRLQLYGGTAPSGAKVTGLRELIPQGLDKALSLVPVGGLQNLPELAISALLQLLDRDFWAAFSSLVLESSFAPPVYGGNQQQGGWKISRFEGDIVGFSAFDPTTGTYQERGDFPISKPDPGPITDPLSTETLLYLDVISVFTGGRIYRTKRDGDPLPPIPGPSN